MVWETTSDSDSDEEIVNENNHTLLNENVFYSKMFLGGKGAKKRSFYSI